MLKSVIAIWYL